MSGSRARLPVRHHVVVASVCWLAIVAALVVQPATAQGQGRTAQGSAASMPPPLSKGCSFDVSSYWRTSVSPRAASAGGRRRLKIGWGTLWCLGKCAGDCGRKAHSCIFRPTPGAILACFAVRCGPKGVRCVRKCF